MKAVKLEITFKSGAQVSVDVADWTLTKNGSDLDKLEWTTPDKGRRRLVRADLNEIVCVVEVRR
jgi:hypothetical protein